MACFRHGKNALMARVKLKGLSCLDKRTQGAKDLLAWRGELLAALGGAENVSPQKRALVDIITRTRLYLDVLDHWLLAQPSLVIVRRRSIIPALRERQGLADSLARLLGQIGLERQAGPIMDLKDYIRQVESEATPQNGGKNGPGDARIDAEHAGRAVALPEGQDARTRQGTLRNEREG
jgi:hypothetical protein